MIPLDATAVLAIIFVCVCAACGGYLCGYFEGKQHGREERPEGDGNWRW